MVLAVVDQLIYLAAYQRPEGSWRLFTTARSQAGSPLHPTPRSPPRSPTVDIGKHGLSLGGSVQDLEQSPM